MAAQTANFQIETNVTGADKAAQMTSALEELQAQIKADTAELRAMQSAMRDMQAGSNVSGDAFKQLRQQINAKKESIASANEQFVKLGGSFGKAASGAGAAEGDIGGLLAAVKGGAGPMGGMLEKVQGMSGAMQKLGAGKALAVGAVAALAVAVVALTAALLAGVAALFQFALASADAARNSKLATEGLAVSSEALAGLGDILPRVQAATGLSADELRGLAQQLAAAGVKADDMGAALKAVAMAKAGGASAEFIKKLNDELKAGKKSAAELAAEVQAKFGGIVAKKMMSLDALSARLKAGIAGIFSGVKIEGFLAALDSIVKLFEESSASGQALRAIAEVVLQPLFDGAASLGPVVRRAFQYLVIGALHAMIGVLKLKNAMAEFANSPAGQVLLTVAKIVGVVIVAALAAAAAIVAIFIAGLGVLAAAAALPFVIMATAINYAGEAWDYISQAPAALIAALQSAYDAVAAIDFGALGSEIISGIVGAITGGASWVVDAMKGLASSAIGAFKGALGISSPSKVFAGFGKNTAEGFVEGVDASGGAVDSAVSNMVEVPGAASGGGGGKGNTFTINIYGAAPDELKSQSFWETVLERAAEMVAPEPEPA